MWSKPKNNCSLCDNRIQLAPGDYLITVCGLSNARVIIIEEMQDKIRAVTQYSLRIGEDAQWQETRYKGAVTAIQREIAKILQDAPVVSHVKTTSEAYHRFTRALLESPGPEVSAGEHDQEIKFALDCIRAPTPDFSAVASRSSPTKFGSGGF